ncbi:Galactose oxidase, central domain [Carpediemonas membranifera]|uniref:Galactose oxidase, central domain n=1 Tax=Carpediemonas membranifera TaxID=201153 RepID=A0A8J6BUJ4_9EUKA|nr:Galactose oxidase, central domain [Carpediemonas membranifera]|eukprot:KAG9390411.1 Galactose oxidase, central domain [Carpediemonas membranifera]
MSLLLPRQLQLPSVAKGYISFHVTGRFVACINGSVLTFASLDEPVSTTYNCTSTSEANFTCVAWHNDTLITGDDTGAVVVWAADLHECSLTPFAQFNKDNDSVRSIVIREYPSPDYTDDDRPVWFIVQYAKIVVVGNSLGHFTRAVSFMAPISCISYSKETDSLISIIQNPVKGTTELCHHTFESEMLGSMKEAAKAKISGVGDARMIVTVLEHGLVATTALGTNRMTVWKLAELSTNTLQTPSVAQIMAVAYHRSSHTLLAAAIDGKAYAWSFANPDGEPSSQWAALSPLPTYSPTGSAQTAVVQAITANGVPHFSLWVGSSRYFVSVAPPLHAAAPGIIAVQQAPLGVRVDLGGVAHRMSLDGVGGLPVSLAVSGPTDAPGLVVAANRDVVTVHHANREGVRLVNTLSASNLGGEVTAVCLPPISEEPRVLFVATSASIHRVVVSGGVIRDSIDIPPAMKGDTIRLLQASANGRYIAAVTHCGLVAVVDASRPSRMTLHKQTVFVSPGDFDFRVISHAVSADGTAVALILSQTLDVIPETSTILVIARTDNGMIDSIDLDQYGGTPSSIAWDATCPRLLGVLVTRSPDDVAADDEDEEGGAAELPCSTVLMSFFHDTTTGRIIQHEDREQPDAAILLSVRAPHWTVLPHSVGSPAKTYTLKDFAGSDSHVDDDKVAGMLDFSYELACGRADRAFELVRGLPGGALWSNLAALCVKNLELPMALQCLAQASDLVGIRIGESGLTTDEQLAMVAMHLGVEGVAQEKLNSYQLADLYVAHSMWAKAMEVAKADAIVAPTVWHSYGRMLEGCGQYKVAAQAYATAGTAEADVPRMLAAAGMLDRATEFGSVSSDWTAKYLESTGKVREAFDLFKGASDSMNVARIKAKLLLQRLRDHPESTESVVRDMLALSSSLDRIQDGRSHYFVGQALEEAAEAAPSSTASLIERAAGHFMSAGYPAHALRLAIDLDDQQIVSRHAKAATNMLKGKRLQGAVQAACKYLLGRGDVHGAVSILQSAGRAVEALQLCLAYPRDPAIARMVPAIVDKIDPVHLPIEQRKALADSLQTTAPDAALRLLISTGEIDEALELCRSTSMTLTDDVAAALLPTGKSSARLEVARFLGDRFADQADHQAAAKYYRIAGEKMRVLQMLLGSRVGDHSGRMGQLRIIQNFAVSARSPEICVAAATSLKHQRWDLNADPAQQEYLDAVAMTVMSLYAKARTLDSLRQLRDFAMSRATAEIDSNRDYDAALTVLVKAKDALDGAAKRQIDANPLADTVREAYVNVNQFVETRSLAADTESGFISGCEDLLAKGTVEPVKRGDIYALLVEFWLKKAGSTGDASDWASAYRYASRMVSDPDIIIRYYLTRENLLPIWLNAEPDEPFPEHLFEEEGEEEVMEEIMSDED